MEAAPEHEEEEDAVFIGGDGEVLADMMGDEGSENTTLCTRFCGGRIGYRDFMVMDEWRQS